MDIIVRSDDSLIGESLQLLVESLARVERVDGLIRLHETANQSPLNRILDRLLETRVGRLDLRRRKRKQIPSPK